MGISLRHWEPVDDTYDLLQEILQQILIPLGLYGWFVIKVACGKKKRKGIVGSSLGNRRVSRVRHLLDYRKENWKKNDHKFYSYWGTISNTNAEPVKWAGELSPLFLFILSRNMYSESAMSMCHIFAPSSPTPALNASQRPEQKTGTKQRNECTGRHQMGTEVI